MRVVITGAAGQIGREMVSELAQTHELRLIDRVPVLGRRSIVADLAKARVRSFLKPWSNSRSPQWMQAFEGVDVVLHLAADRSPKASWERVLRNNIEVTWNVCGAAMEHRVPRVVFASSNYAVKALEQQWAPACYEPSGPKIDSDCEPRPLTPYGISKATGEVIGQTLVAEGKLDSFVAVRIGAFSPTPPKNPPWRNLWIDPPDIRTLLRRCVEAQFSGFQIVYGVSAQLTAPYDLSHTCSILSWQPSGYIDSQVCDTAASHVKGTFCYENRRYRTGF
jgi:NAD(P)-dependent dehydrogenase (short-subunit alcohol dehydrogenase family)